MRRKSNASKTDRWIMVRLTRETHATLRAWGATWMEKSRVEPGKRGNGEFDQPSLDTVIGELLRRDQEHREAGKRSAAKRKAKRRADKGSTGEEPEQTAAD